MAELDGLISVDLVPRHLSHALSLALCTDHYTYLTSL